MFEGYASFAGTEVFNAARTAAYVTALLPQVEVRCDYPGLPAALGHSEYSTPDRDMAPWYRGQRPAGARFYGLFPGKITGAEDSTRTAENTELVGNGSAITSPRYKSREIRFTATAFAADEEAMEEGLSWLRTVLADEGCSGAALGCTGHELSMFAAEPSDIVAAYNLARTFHKVETTEGPLVVEKLNSAAGCLWRIEWTLTCGRPWPFTNTHEVGTLVMDTALNFQDPAGEDCSINIDGYDDFIDDPFFTAISRPPRPPIVLPPNLLAIHSWRRLSLPVPAAYSDEWGKVVPVINIVAPNPTQYLRLRFYRDGAAGCDFDGEFYISYIPGGAVLTLDGISQEASVTLADGRIVPAGNLLFGSDGRPVLWPELGCQLGYTMVADLMPGQAGLTVALDVAVRL